MSRYMYGVLFIPFYVRLVSDVVILPDWSMRIIGKKPRCENNRANLTTTRATWWMCTLCGLVAFVFFFYNVFVSYSWVGWCSSAYNAYNVEYVQCSWDDVNYDQPDNTICNSDHQNYKRDLGRIANLQLRHTRETWRREKRRIETCLAYATEEVDIIGRVIKLLQQIWLSMPKFVDGAQPRSVF